MANSLVNVPVKKLAQHGPYPRSRGFASLIPLFGGTTLTRPVFSAPSDRFELTEVVDVMPCVVHGDDLLLDLVEVS